MLELTLEASKGWDDDDECFVNLPKVRLRLEHSLYSMARWESKYKRAFLDGKRSKSPEELMYYVRCMSEHPIDTTAVMRLGASEEAVAKVNEYISDPYTATTITDYTGPMGKGKLITAEIIYGWMIAYRIPFECQHWHLNRLLTLIRVCAIQQDPKPKKRAMRDVIAERNALNAQRNAEARKADNG